MLDCLTDDIFRTNMSNTEQDKATSFIDDTPILETLDWKLVESSEYELASVANPQSSVLRERPEGRGNALNLIREKYATR